MTYICNKNLKDKYFKISSRNISPYYEITDISSEPVEVNINPRLKSILFNIDNCNPANDFFDKAVKNESPSLSVDNIVNCFKTEPVFQDIFNILLHIVADIDKFSGMSMIDLRARFILEEILESKYGEEIRNRFCLLTENHKRILCCFISKYILSDELNIQFYNCLKAVFTSIKIFLEEKKEIVHICVNSEENNYNNNLFQLIKTLFNPIENKVEVYWRNQQFGIIGEDWTMLIGSIYVI